VCRGRGRRWLFAYMALGMRMRRARGCRPGVCEGVAAEPTEVRGRLRHTATATTDELSALDTGRADLAGRADLHRTHRRDGRNGVCGLGARVRCLPRRGRLRQKVPARHAEALTALIAASAQWTDDALVRGGRRIRTTREPHIRCCRTLRRRGRRPGVSPIDVVGRRGLTARWIERRRRGAAGRRHCSKWWCGRCGPLSQPLPALLAEDKVTRIVQAARRANHGRPMGQRRAPDRQRSLCLFAPRRKIERVGAGGGSFGIENQVKGHRGPPARTRGR